MPDDDLQQLEDQVRRGFAAWNAGDFERFLAEVNPDIEYAPGIVVGRAAGEPVVYRGREELRGFFDEWHSQWKMEITVGEVEQVGDWALILGRARLTGVQSGAAFEQDVGWIAQRDDEGRLLRMQSLPSHDEARAAFDAQM